jgi:hypothetical protein
MSGDFQFEKFLASRRENPVILSRRKENPYADTIAKDLDRNLKAVKQWLNGDVNAERMTEAMEFFNAVFPGQYDAPEGLTLYRGQATNVTDGSPRSYSHDEKIADMFACEPGGGPFAHFFASHTNAFLISRKVCYGCADKDAFRLTLDLAKVLEDYGESKHKFSVEKEVVILNTKPKGATAHIFEILCDREAA